MLEEAQARAVETNQDRSTYNLYDIDHDGVQELFVHFGRFQLRTRHEVYAFDATGATPHARLIGSWETDGPSTVFILADGSLVASSLGAEYDGGRLVAAYFGRLEKEGQALVVTPIPADRSDPMYEGSVQMGEVALPVYFVPEIDYNPADETVERHYVDLTPLTELGDLPTDAMGESQAGGFLDGGSRCYRRADGSLVRDALVDTGDAKYLFDSEGRLVFGRAKVFGVWHEFDGQTGAMID